MGTADVPVAVALSGGIDSSLGAAVIYIMARTFTLLPLVILAGPILMKEKMQRN